MGVYVCVCAGKPEAIVSQGNIRAVPESKENIKTDFFIVSPRDKVRTEARSGQTGRKKRISLNKGYKERISARDGERPPRANFKIHTYQVSG